MSAAENVLTLLEDVRQTGADRWIARCPAHDDKTPSLSLRQADDGRVLLHCFSGCGALEILDALSLEWSALFPPLPLSGPHTPSGIPRRVRPRISASDALAIMHEEALTVCFVARRLEEGEPVALHGEHLRRAASRINEIHESWVTSP